MKYSIISSFTKICIASFLCVTCYMLHVTCIKAYTITPADVTVSATISGPEGEGGGGQKGGQYSLFGYTSPYAKVMVNNSGLYIDTNADDQGYFEFINYFLPQQNSQPQIEDICLTAQDQSGRVTMPVCIPPIPSEADFSVGPVIMPPTITVNSDSFYVGDTITVSGQTTPNTEIKLSMFTDESKTIFRALISPIDTVYAASLPKQNMKVTQKGEFTMKLPSDSPEYYRMFAQTLFDQSFSPKSVTLNFDILPSWFVLMKIVLGFLSLFKSHWLEIALFIQAIIFIYWLFKKYTHPHYLARLRALTVVQHAYPAVIPHEVLLLPHELLLTPHQLLTEETKSHMK